MRPRRKPADPYAALGVEPGASRAEVRRAYRRRALAIHPDIAGPEATEEMAQLNQARDQLESRGSADPTRPAPGAGARHTEPRERPAWASAHESAWTDHWAAWNEPRRRE